MAIKQRDSNLQQWGQQLFVNDCGSIQKWVWQHDPETKKNYPKLRSPQKIGVWPTTDGGLKPAGFMGRIIIEQENLYSINQLEGMGMTDDFVHVPVGNGIRMCWGDKWFQGFFI